MNEPRELHVLIFKEEGAYLAQCIEIDICAQGYTYEQVMQRFLKTATAQALIDEKHGQKPFEKTPESPAEFGKRYTDASIISQKYFVLIDEEPAGDEECHLELLTSRIIAEVTFGIDLKITPNGGDTDDQVFNGVYPAGLE